MRHLTFYTFLLSLLCFLSCQKEDIITSKPGESIAGVSNLQYTILDTTATLTWTLPTTYPADIVQPVSVLVHISEDGRNVGSQVLADAPQSFTYLNYHAPKKYRFTVKVQGAVNTIDQYRSKLRISLGQTVAF